jgi:spore coat polysaccharide biosynthesis predicted glycosyltransferase SpsG
MGHVMRCLSLADASEQKAVFVLADDNVRAFVENRGHQAIVLNTDYRNMEDELSFWEPFSPDLIFVDSYFVTPGYLMALKRKAKLVYLDDLCAFPYPADVVVNYNVYSQSLDYTSMYKESGVSEPRLLLGTAYTPLRSMFQDVPLKVQKRDVCHVLLSTGGTDTEHIALQFVEACPSGFIFHILVGALNPDSERIKKVSGNNIVIHQNVSDMRSFLEKMDIAVAAAGSTLYEICACGVPLITYVIAENQILGAEAFERLGLAENLGDMREKGNAAQCILGAIERLRDDYNRRCEMGHRMQTIIDGKGAKRLWSLLYAE